MALPANFTISLTTTLPATLPPTGMETRDTRAFFLARRTTFPPRMLLNTLRASAPRFLDERFKLANRSAALRFFFVLALGFPPFAFAVSPALPPGTAALASEPAGAVVVPPPAPTSSAAVSVSASPRIEAQAAAADAFALRFFTSWSVDCFLDALANRADAAAASAMTPAVPPEPKCVRAASTSDTLSTQRTIRNKVFILCGHVTICNLVKSGHGAHLRSTDTVGRSCGGLRVSSDQSDVLIYLPSKTVVKQSSVNRNAIFTAIDTTECGHMCAVS